MKYKYTIVGRSPGSINHTTYTGTLEGCFSDHDRSLVLAAFGAQFGPLAEDDEYHDAIQEATIMQQANGRINACVDTGEFTFDIEIEEAFMEKLDVLIEWCKERITEFDIEIEEVTVGDGQPFPDNYEAFMEKPDVLIEWCKERITEFDAEASAKGDSGFKADDIDSELVVVLEAGMKYDYREIDDAAEVLENYIITLRDGCKGWGEMSREQLLEAIWNAHGDPYANNDENPTWEGFLKQFE